MSLTVLVPVLGRPHRVEPLLDSIAFATPGACSVLFICDPEDEAEKQAIYAAKGSLIEVDGGYAQKINAAVRQTEADLLFFGADDLEFQRGWLEAAKAKLVDGVEVVGVNDLIQRRRTRRGHATHFLVSRAYAALPTIDAKPGPLHEGYSHWCVDDEFAATARKREAYAYAEDSHVRHLHPFAGLAEDDETYAKGRAKMRIDLRLFARREALWT